MVKITVKKDCGNAPKILFLKDFNIAVVRNDPAFVRSKLTDDVRWRIVGGKDIEGKEKVLEALGKRRNREITELEIQNIITHGYNGAANGLLKFKGGEVLAFCDIYTFQSPRNNAPVKAIISYLIKLSS